MKTDLRWNRVRVLLRHAARLCTGLMVLVNASTASAQAPAASAYRYAMPAGWTQSIEADIEALSPSDGQAQAQIMLLPPKPLAGDFDSQFASERASLESFWGLRAPQAVPPQRGQSSKGLYAAHFASYDSDGGERYMSFLALGNAGSFAMVVFVAATPDTFNRLAPVATNLFRTMDVVRR